MKKLIFGAAVVILTAVAEGHKLEVDSEVRAGVHSKVKALNLMKSNAVDVEDAIENLAELRGRALRPSSVISSSSSKNNDSFFGGFIGGCFMIGLALPMVWMNERRQVHMYKVYSKAQ